MPGQIQPRSARGRVAAVIATALTGCLVASCGGSAAEERVAPLRGAGTSASDTESPPPSRSTQADRTSESAGDQTRSPQSRSAVDPDQAQVTELLKRFDAAISALYADPLAAGDDRHALSVDWLRVVVGGSQLDREVRSEILAAGRDDSIRIVPDSEGVSFSNVAIDVTRETDGSLTWTNCGYAPGVAIDTGNGEVRDDNRTSTRGRGRAIEEPDGEMIISELWDDETYLLEPQETDPCPTLVGSAGTPRTDNGR